MIWARVAWDHSIPRVALVEQLTKPVPKRILELGCGSGITAGALALAGHSVVAVEIAPVAAAHARQVGATIPESRLEIVEGDFLEIEQLGMFEVVCYFDGFGVGSNDDQRRLLRRIAVWMRPDGYALIDVYNPCFFAREPDESTRRLMTSSAATDSTRRVDS